MNDQRLENLVGALAVAISDEVVRTTTSKAPEPGPAAAALTLIGNAPGMTIETLRRALRLSHPGTVRLIDRLAADGLVERLPSEEDRRAVALHLTRSGEKQHLAILSARRGGVAGVLDQLTAAERAALGALAEKMLRGLVRDEDHGWIVCRLCDEHACGDCPIDRELAARE